MKYINRLWDFFASVRLAILTLCSLALTSIIGTIIPQGEPFPRYVEEYGPVLAQFLQVLDFPNMYSSWWFLGLLGILCANLIICSIDRFPTSWRLITADQLGLSPERLGRMDHSETWTLTAPVQDASQLLQQRLEKAGWRISNRKNDNSLMIYAQKGAWSRLGVYLVHLSILIIFVGAVIGNFLGFKGNVMIPETESTNKVFASSNAEPLDLGFEIRCDAFNIEFYPNGMPKEYRSRLTVRENGQDVRQEDIEVNKPLSYKGITFYQSSYEGYKDFLMTFIDPTDQTSKTFKAPFQKEVDWPEKGIRFGVINAETSGDRILRTKIWLQDEDRQPSTFWLEPGGKTEVKVQGKTMLFSAKQMYATGLQVAKDPGVWFVYSGCIMMLLGLYVAFFLSHRRVWLLLRQDAVKGSTLVLLAASANKNKTGFAVTFTRLNSLLRAI